MRRGLWNRFWERAPRQLRFTRAGRLLVAIAFAAGLAAMNTGNNLLFFGWGMVLSAIIVSGVLSEATLRNLASEPGSPSEARVDEMAYVPVALANTSPHMPAYAVELLVSLKEPLHHDPITARAPYQLRLAPASQNTVYARFEPRQRGRVQILHVAAKTAYPFGFFEKSRRLTKPDASGFWVFPKKVDVAHMLSDVMAQLGEVPEPRPGMGEDFFSLRPYRQGDDPRRIQWRRSARSGALMLVEAEAQSGREVLLELMPPPLAHAEAAIAALGSLAEALLARGLQVGVRAPGLSLPTGAGGRQRLQILAALARLDAAGGLPPLRQSGRVARIVLQADADGVRLAAQTRVA